MPALGPVLEQIGSLTERIRDYDRKLVEISKESYPETELLRQVAGVGPLTALAFVLTIEDPYRFERSRAVGAYLGLVPATNQSGDRDPQKRISKEGDEMLRKRSSLLYSPESVEGELCELRIDGVLRSWPRALGISLN
jgi:transposase